MALPDIKIYFNSCSIKTLLSVQTYQWKGSLCPQTDTMHVEMHNIKNETSQICQK